MTTALPKDFVFDPTYIPRSRYEQRVAKEKEEKKQIVKREVQPTHLFRNGKEKLITLCTYNILLFNDILCGQIVQMVATMKKSSYYKQKVKKLCNEISEWRKFYERRLKEIMNESDMQECFMEMCDNYTSNFEQNTTMFTFAVKQSLDNIRVKESMAIAKVVVARVYADMAETLFDDRMKQLEEEGAKPIWFTLSYLNPHRVRYLLNELEKSFDIEDVECKQAQTCIDIMHGLLEKADLIADAVNTGDEQFLVLREG